MEDQPPMNELEMLKMKMNAKTDESVDSTRRMVKLCEEGQDAGVKTLQMLDSQEEQLNRVNANLDHIGEDMKEAERNLNNMEKCCGLCILPWNRQKQRSTAYKTSGKGDGGDEPGFGAGAVVYSAEKNGRTGVVTVKQPQGSYITRITNDAREDEMERNLEDISGMVGNMRSMAVDMGSTVTKSNEVIEHIKIKTETTVDRVRDADKRAAKLAK